MEHICFTAKSSIINYPKKQKKKHFRCQKTIVKILTDDELYIYKD